MFIKALKQKQICMQSNFVPDFRNTILKNILFMLELHQKITQSTGSIFWTKYDNWRCYDIASAIFHLLMVFVVFSSKESTALYHVRRIQYLSYFRFHNLHFIILLHKNDFFSKLWVFKMCLWIECLSYLVKLHCVWHGIYILKRQIYLWLSYVSHFLLTGWYKYFYEKFEMFFNITSMEIHVPS